MNQVPPDAVVLKADIKPIAEIPRHYRKLPRAQRSDISAAPQLLRRAESVRGRAGFRGAVNHFSKSRPWSIGERTLEVRGLFGPPTTLPQPSEAKVIEINKIITNDGIEQGEDGQDQQQANDGFARKYPATFGLHGT